MAKIKEYNTKQLEALVQKCFAKDEGWVTLFEVSDRTPNPMRRCDVIAFNIWNTRNNTKMWGMEIKSSRQDWLNELADPSKAETFKKYCHHWWLIAPEHIVKDGELPEGWGHMIPSPRGATLRHKVDAPLLEPQDVPRDFMTVLVRNAFDMNWNERNAIRFNEQEKAEKYWEGKFAKRLERKEKEIEEFKNRIEIFQAFSGIDIRTYYDREHRELKQIGQLLYRVIHEPDLIPQMKQKLLDTAKTLHDQSENILTSVTQYEKENPDE